jgi:hypothetical protein
MRLPHRFAASTPFSSFDNNFFDAFAFVVRPPVAARFEPVRDGVSIGVVAVATAVSGAVVARVCSDSMPTAAVPVVA